MISNGCASFTQRESNRDRARGRETFWSFLLSVTYCLYLPIRCIVDPSKELKIDLQIRVICLFQFSGCVKHAWTIVHIMFKRMVLKGLVVGAALVQYGCIAHCTLEFVADFVVVRTYWLGNMYFSQNKHQCENLYRISCYLLDSDNEFKGAFACWNVGTE